MKAGTPGPWAVFLDTDPMNEDGAVCVSGNDHEIRPAAGQKLGDEAADFRLMAAAPDLLEALEKLARLGNGEHYGNSDGNMIARAAIAKATGGAA
jgi:hypothetical protein